MKTLEQEFAAKIYPLVKARQSDGKDDQKRYGSMGQKLPVLIRTAGLAQALAFVEAKASGVREKPYHQLLNDLAAVLGFESRNALLKRSRIAKLPEYTALTRKTILALTWFKRFSQSVLGVDPTQGD